MIKQTSRVAGQHPCSLCPLEKLDHFRDFDEAEQGFMQSFKMGETRAEAGATLFVEGSHSAHLYTVLKGWAFRYKTLEDGRRQILNYVMPGDLIGLQGGLMDEMQHSIETLTPVTLCMFERDRLQELYSKFPSLAFDVTWIAAREERMLDEHLLSVGRRTALERAAYLLVFLYHRAKLTRAAEGAKFTLPVTQQHIADTLGLSLVHTNKTLRKLVAKDLISWRDKGCQVRDEAGLVDVAQWKPQYSHNRPFL